MGETVGGQRKMRIQVKKVLTSLYKGTRGALQAPGVPQEPKGIPPTWRQHTRVKVEESVTCQSGLNMGASNRNPEQIVVSLSD